MKQVILLIFAVILFSGCAEGGIADQLAAERSAMIDGSVPEHVSGTESVLDTKVATRRLAFVSVRDGNADIFTVRADGSELRKLTNSQGLRLYSHPQWSPDGEWIAFSSDRDRPGDPDIYIMRADGSDVQRITNDAAEDWSPVWSPR